MSNECRIFIVRHGEAEWNVKKLLQGSHDSPLTSTGEWQARSVAEKLKHIHFDALYSSDLIRAKRTAEIMALERTIAIQTKEILRERSFGEFEGKSLDYYYKKLRDSLKVYRELPNKKKLFYRLAKGVETDEETISRFITVLREIALAHMGKTVMVVSHGGLMRMLLLHLGMITYETITQ